jgi:enoyl-CoA hydratase/carnithine racemase
VPIRYEASGAVVIITIDRPEAMNALDPAHNEALTGAFERFEREDSARVAVLTGAGNAAFSAGADLRKLIPPFHDAVRAGGSPPWALGGITDKAINKPTIAAVNGHALAGGLELALACDIRIASVNATFGLAETKWGLIPGAGGTQRLPQVVPLGPAMEMILTGEPIDAGQALRWGLVNRVLPSDRLLPEAIAMASTVAARGPLAVRAARAAVLEGLGCALADGLGLERKHFLDIMRTGDAVEGARAFAEKRPPQFEGK